MTDTAWRLFKAEGQMKEQAAALAVLQQEHIALSAKHGRQERECGGLKAELSAARAQLKQVLQREVQYKEALAAMGSQVN